MNERFDSAAAALIALENHQVIDWEPGDGTRYELVLVKDEVDGSVRNHYLICLNLRFWCNAGISTLGGFIHTNSIPPGAYAGMRPILVMLDWADKSVTEKAGQIPTYDPYWSKREAEERSGRDFASTERYADRARDAILGRRIRALVTGQDPHGQPSPEQATT